MDSKLIEKVLNATNNILIEIYGDLAKPAVSEVGQAIGTLIGLGNTLLLPLALKNAKSKIILQDNLEEYRKKLERVSEENIQAVIPEIGVPILEKLMYVSDDTLIELYTELLTKASNKLECDLTHPSFVNIINNISPKEAKLLSIIQNNIRIGFVDVSVNTEKGSHPIERVTELVLMNEFYDKNLKSFLSNLVGLGLIEVDNNVQLKDTEKY